MATLTDFQIAIAQITTATQNISAYVQGTGMSAQEQNEALTSLQSAVAALTAAVPVAPTTTEAHTEG